MSSVLGKNVNLYAKVDGVYKLALCGKSCTLAIQSEIAERTTPESGIFKQFKALGVSANIQLEGDIELGVDLGTEQFINWQLALERIFWVFELVSQNASIRYYSGWAYIENVQQTGVVESYASYSLNLIVDGEITVS